MVTIIEIYPNSTTDQLKITFGELASSIENGRLKVNKPNVGYNK